MGMVEKTLKEVAECYMNQTWFLQQVLLGTFPPRSDKMHNNSWSWLQHLVLSEASKEEPWWGGLSLQKAFISLILSQLHYGTKLGFGGPVFFYFLLFCFVLWLLIEGNMQTFCSFYLSFCCEDGVMRVLLQHNSSLGRWLMSCQDFCNKLLFQRGK